MQGNLSQIGLTDILTLATSGHKSGALNLTRGKETVEIYLADGQVVHATCPIGDGEKALLYPVTWDDGTFTLDPNRSASVTTINKPAEDVLKNVKAMSQEWEAILEVVPSPKAVFQIADPGEEQGDPITVPHVGWRVLSRVDGHRTVQEVTELLRIPYAYTAKVLFKLFNDGLIEPLPPAPVHTAADCVPPALLNRIAIILTEIIGPMAPLVLSDQVQSLGENQDIFPEAKLDELISLVSREINNPKLRNKFEQSVFQEVSTFKKF